MKVDCTSYFMFVVVGWGTLFVPLIKGGLCLSLSDLHLVGSPGCGDLKDVSQGVLLTCHSPGAWPGGPVPPLGVTTMWTVSGAFSYGLDRRTVTALLSRKWYLLGRESLEGLERSKTWFSNPAGSSSRVLCLLCCARPCNCALIYALWFVRQCD